MRQKNIFFLIILFAVFFAYITNIVKIPKNITLYQNEEYQIEYLKGINIDSKSVYEKENFFNKLATINTNFIGNMNLKLSSFWGLFNKTITVNVVPSEEVIPGGDLIGIKLYSKGALIVGESKIQGVDGKFYEPYKKGTFKAGDILTKIDNYEVESAKEIETIINNIGDKEVLLTCERNGEAFFETINPIKSIDDGKYKIGLWVRDGAMGVGTLSFYSPKYSKFAALGHGISDEDSKNLINVEIGDIYRANILSVTKGRSEAPGEIRGLLDERNELGDIEINSKNGIYGDSDYELTNMTLERQSVPIASKNEIKLGNAKILCTVDETQEVKEYDIDIQKISTSSMTNSKGMIIKVTDENLISKTGGIVQGMSGSPIIQNGKLIGAVTHVYVNDPTKGYAIFAETMINEMRN